MSEQALRNIQEAYSTGTLRPNALDGSGLSLLHYAAYDGQLLCVKCLISYGADIHARSREGFVAAHYAAAGGHLPVLQYLYDRDKTSVTVRNEFDLTPLYIATQEGQLDCLIWLNKYTRSVKIKTSIEQMNPALVAAQEGRLDCLRYLARVERELMKMADRNGFNVIHYAASEGHSRVLKWLIEHCKIGGGKQSNSGQTALHIAAIGGHASSIEMLIKCGVALDISDEYGKTAYDYSTNSNQECKELLQRKMSILFEGSDAESEKKVRFDESVQLHETFPTHHHTTLHDSKNSRRKERSGIFWDADLQAEFETWRVNSPNLSGSRGTRRNKKAANNHQNQRDKEPYLISRGQSKAIRNLMKQHRTSASSSLSRSSTAPTTPLTPMDKPDLLKHIDEQFEEAIRKEQRQQKAATQQQSNAPPVPARKNAWKRKKQQTKFKVTDENIQHSLRKYHSIDIGQALQEFDSLNSVPTTPNEMGLKNQHNDDSSALSSVPTTPSEFGFKQENRGDLSAGLNSSGNSAASTPLDYEKLFYGELPSPQLASTPINDGTESGRTYEPIPSPLSYTTDENSVSMEPFSFLSLEEPPAGPPTPPVRTNGEQRRKKREQQNASGSKRNSFKEFKNAAINNNRHSFKESMNNNLLSPNPNQQILAINNSNNRTNSFKKLRTTNNNTSNKRTSINETLSLMNNNPLVNTANPNQHLQILSSGTAASSLSSSSSMAAASSLSPNTLVEDYYRSSRASSERSVSPMLRNLRYKDMGNNHNNNNNNNNNNNQAEDIYQPASLYLAQSGGTYGKLDRVRSYSANDLVDRPSSRERGNVLKPFTDYLYEQDDGKEDYYNPVSSVYSGDNYTNKNLFSKKKKKFPSLIRGVTSLLSTIRQRKEDPYEIYFSNPSTSPSTNTGRATGGASAPPAAAKIFATATKKGSNGNNKGGILNYVTLPRAKRTGFNLDELFTDSSPVGGVYKSSATSSVGSHTPSPKHFNPQKHQHYTQKNSSFKRNPAASIGFNNRNNLADQSLRGKSQYVKYIEDQQTANTSKVSNNNNGDIYDNNDDSKQNNTTTTTTTNNNTNNNNNNNNNNDTNNNNNNNNNSKTNIANAEYNESPILGDNEFQDVQQQNQSNSLVLPLGGRLRANSNSKKEKVNAIIW